MDELIVLLIKWIIRMLSAPPPGGPQRRVISPPPPMSAPPQFQPRPGNVATARRPGAVTPRRAVRRPGSAMVGIAAPIMTPTGDDLELDPPAQQMTKTTAATNIRASRGSVLDKSDARSAASPTDVRRWLTPAALRQQVVLAEILGKPVALRDDR